jgi:F-type H+-transporting ATPase subunit a
MFSSTHFTLTYMMWAIIVLFIVLYGAMKFRAGAKQEGGMIPPARFTTRTFFEMITDATYGMMVQVMGEKSAKRHLPLIGSCAFFIFFSNIMALIPGAGVPTTTLNTNIGLLCSSSLPPTTTGSRSTALPTSSILQVPAHPGPADDSHRAHQPHRAAGLPGPAPDGQHGRRPQGRLYVLHPGTNLLVPVPFLFLGTLVSIVQTLVFCLLSMVYISMATAHDH